MEKVLIVGIGGFLGSIGRYALGGAAYRIYPQADFPYGTVAVNLLGCTLIGIFGALGDVRNVLSPEARMFLLIGVLGGFTTFSSFAYETLALARDGESLKAVLNVALQVVGSLLAVWLGDSIMRATLGGP